MRIAIVVYEWVTREHGQDLLEYSMLVGLIAVVAIGAITAVSNSIINVLWSTVVNNY